MGDRKLLPSTTELLALANKYLAADYDHLLEFSRKLVAFRDRQEQWSRDHRETYTFA